MLIAPKLVGDCSSTTERGVSLKSFDRLVSTTPPVADPMLSIFLLNNTVHEIN